MAELTNVNRCQAPLGGGVCNSAVFYDWGLAVAGRYSYKGPTGNMGDRYTGTTTMDNVKICARCTTPYIITDGELVDISDELSGEDVKAILSRGQATLPHVKIKDP